METAMSWREEALEEGLQKGLEQAQSWREEALEEGLQKGLEKGLEQGLEKGLREGKQHITSLVVHLIEKRLGRIDSGLQERIGRLDSPNLEKLGEALLDFDEIGQLTVWLQHR